MNEQPKAVADFIRAIKDGNEIPAYLPPNTRNADPVTSQRAAAKINEGARGAQAQRVLALVRANPGLTAPELAKLSDLDRYQISRRTSDLKSVGLLRIEGERDGNGCWWPTR